MREDEAGQGGRGGACAFRVAVVAAVVGSLMFVAAVVIVLDLVR